MSVYKKFAGQTIIYGVSTVFSRVLNFFLTPVYTSVYPTSVYGIFTNMYSWAALINAVLSFGMETTFFRYLNKYEDRKQDVYNNAFLTVAFLGFLFFCTGMVFSGSIASGLADGGTVASADYRQYIHYFLCILLVDALCVIPFAKLRADGRPLRYGTIKFLNIGAFIGLNLVFLFLIPAIIRNDWPLSGWLSGWYRQQWIGYVFISNLAASVLTMIMLLPEFMKLRLRFERRLFADMFSYSWPILVANISFVINENLDKIVLKELVPGAGKGFQDTGIYGASAKIAVFLSIFIQAFRLGAEPFFFNHAKEKNARETYATILQYFVIVVAFIFLALVANIEILKYFIRGKDAAQQALYWSGLQVVPILLFGYVCLGIYMNLSIWYRLSDQTRFGLYISGFGAVLTIILNVILIPRYSYVGAAWVSLLAYLSMMVLSYVLGHKHYPIPYPLLRMLGYLLLSTVLVYASFYIFNRNIYIGNLFLVLFAAVIWLREGQKLKMMLRAKK
ncbi:polysaccharide biosynthesis protein [Pedobacter yulinensis]|uniref:Polysaccharide biosynthesis protein n=1 Tax=Pedobacter yulinensis TaxID=2126353 RepID=A0A2T3HQF3_9SPHI|nr:polysaccharide biosynthesis C-terminal domain-containing protein [Pedobacter yulinensis]PST84678.1 polysaccharide biosynthesis protein [Pedobacter yulinensis]